MQTGLRFLFVVTILLHLVNFVEKTRTEWTTSSYGKKSQLLPWVAGKQSLSFHPTRCLAAEDTECTCRALGTQEGARASPQHPAHPARCFGVGRQFHPLQWEWVRGKVVSLPWWRMCYCFRWVSERLACLFFFFLTFLPCSALQREWIKESQTKILGKHPHLEIADGWGRFSLLLAQNCCSPAYTKCMACAFIRAHVKKLQQNVLITLWVCSWFGIF